MQAPDAATIRKAIVAEARRQGKEGQLREDEPPARPRRMFNTLDMMNTADMDPNLVRLLEQVMGGAPLAIPGGVAVGGQQEGEEEPAEQASDAGASLVTSSQYQMSLLWRVCAIERCSSCSAATNSPVLLCVGVCFMATT